MNKSNLDLTFVRAKRADSNSWIHGRYVYLECFKKNLHSHRIYVIYSETDCGEFYPECYEINPDTLGRFTGLYDVDENRIFEGDFITLVSEVTGEELGQPHEVIWDEQDCCWALDFRWGDYLDLCKGLPYKVVGNIYDNKELVR